MITNMRGISAIGQLLLHILLLGFVLACENDNSDKKFSGENQENASELPPPLYPPAPNNVLDEAAPDFVILDFDIEGERKRLINVIEASGLPESEKSELKTFIENFDFSKVANTKDFVDTFIADLLNRLPDESKETIQVVKDSTLTATENIVAEENEKPRIRQEIFSEVFQKTAIQKNISIDQVREATTEAVKETGYWSEKEIDSVVDAIVTAVIKATDEKNAIARTGSKITSNASETGVTLSIDSVAQSLPNCQFRWNGSAQFPPGYSYKPSSAKANLLPTSTKSSNNLEWLSLGADEKGVLATVLIDKVALGDEFAFEWSLLATPDDFGGKITLPVQKLISTPTQFGPTNSGYQHIHTQLASNCSQGFAASITTGLEHTCAIDKDGKIQCVGQKNGANFINAESGDVNSTPTALPVIDPNNSVRALSGSNENMCAVLTNGAMYCLGSNGNGQNGNGATTTTSTPTLVIGIDGSSASKRVRSAAGSFDAMAAVMQDGSIKTWGSNRNGQLGLGLTTENFSIPQAIASIDGSSPDKTILAIDAGEGWMLGLLANGTLKSWGENSSGQLGNGDKTNQSSPVKVLWFDGSSPEKTAIQIAAGDDHGCAVTKVGSVYCWGGIDGEYSPGEDDKGSLTPIPISPETFNGNAPETTVVALSSYNDSNCALMLDGKLKCWGRNEFGILGLGDKQYRASPVEVAPDLFNGSSKATTIVALNMSVFHVCAATADGSLYCWGSNRSAAIGLPNETEEVAVPTRIGEIGAWGAAQSFTLKAGPFN